jgi:hypothetical protein
MSFGSGISTEFTPKRLCHAFVHSISLLQSDVYQDAGGYAETTGIPMDGTDGLSYIPL